jgi:TPR repeat protein
MVLDATFCAGLPFSIVRPTLTVPWILSVLADQSVIEFLGGCLSLRRFEAMPRCSALPAGLRDDATARIRAAARELYLFVRGQVTVEIQKLFADAGVPDARTDYGQELLRNPDGDLRLAIGYAAGNFGGGIEAELNFLSGTPNFLTVVGRYVPSVPASAKSAIGHILPRLRDSNSATRSAAVSSLVEVCKDEWDAAVYLMSELTPFFGHAREEVRQSAVSVPVRLAEAKPEFGTPLVDAIAPLLTNSSTPVRTSAVESLDQLILNEPSLANALPLETEHAIGTMFLAGDGVGKNSMKAIQWFARCAADGYAPAQFSLGVLHEKGEEVRKNPMQAVHWYSKAAAQGHVRAQTRLGVMCWEGRGVPQDLAWAFEMFTVAARQDDPEGQFYAALAYYSGNGCLKDFEAAFNLWVAAAGHGHMASQNNVGEMYRDGEGVSRDTNKAIEWFTQAEMAGYVAAQFNLGMEYHRRKDFPRAFHWWERAAQQGHAPSQNNIGEMLNDGEGTAQNSLEALRW